MLPLGFGFKLSGNTQWVTYNGIQPSNYEDFLKLYKYNEPCWGVVYEADRIRRLNLRFPTDLKVSEDVVFNMRYFERNDVVFKFINRIFYEYNVGNSNSATTIDKISIDKGIAQLHAANMLLGVEKKSRVIESYFCHVALNRLKYALYVFSIKRNEISSEKILSVQSSLRSSFFRLIKHGNFLLRINREYLSTCAWLVISIISLKFYFFLKK